jgi:uracil-DNA glycosylase
MQVKINESWNAVLQSEFDQKYFEELVGKVKDEYSSRTVFPAPLNIFRAFDVTSFERVKVVILGQDPYHTPKVADGLAFSTSSGNRVPPSLQNIYKEIVDEFSIMDYPFLKNPDLTRWAEQGVLLLNTTLTVIEAEPNSHSKYGWDRFTDRVIDIIASQKENIVFILWGANTRKKKLIIDTLLNKENNHLIMESAHPSPLSAHNGFLGNGHFYKCNEFLEENKLSPINW